jgi:hypothetical protein
MAPTTRVIKVPGDETVDRIDVATLKADLKDPPSSKENAKT